VIVEGADLTGLASRLASIDGVVGVVLGGSRARGTHRPDSDTDLGLYYRGSLDVAGLQALADDVADGPVEVTEPGGWGPWVDGGGWLDVHGHRVDWIYRDLDRVDRVWGECRAGRYEIGFQVGHPLGFYSHAYAGEVALGRILADPSGALGRRQAETREYPPALGAALVRGLWEADFALRIAGYGVSGQDVAYVSGALFRFVGVLCQGLHGRSRRWLTNEKGAVTATAALPFAPAGFAERAFALFDGDDLSARLDRARQLLDAVRDAVA